MIGFGVEDRKSWFRAAKIEIWGFNQEKLNFNHHFV
jgi:hypothetical protein